VRAVTRPVVRQMHLLLNLDDLWALMHSAVDDWQKVIGLNPEDLMLTVTHLDHSPNNPEALVRICLSLEERDEEEG
jgi:hypothetical protein